MLTRFLPKWRPSRNQLIFFGTSSAVYGYYAYDRKEFDRIQKSQIARVTHIADQPMALDEVARKLRVLISAVSINDGVKIKQSFDAYVKPVWDAAALDYEVIEEWEWFDTAKSHVARKVTHEQWDKMSNDDIEKLRVKWDLEGGDGWVGLGRPAFKAVVSGMADLVLAEAQQQLAQQDAKPSTQELGESSSGGGWFSWLWGNGSHESNDKSPEEQEVRVLKHHHTEEDDAFELVKMPKPLPPVGYVPIRINRWLKRVFYFFHQRWLVKQTGEAAVVVALGHHIPMDQLFPGDLLFEIEPSERRKDDDKVETLENKTSGEGQTSDTTAKQSRIEQVVVPEPVVAHLQIYHKA